MPSMNCRWAMKKIAITGMMLTSAGHHKRPFACMLGLKERQAYGDGRLLQVGGQIDQWAQQIVPRTQAGEEGECGHRRPGERQLNATEDPHQRRTVHPRRLCQVKRNCMTVLAQEECAESPPEGGQPERRLCTDDPHPLEENEVGRPCYVVGDHQGGRQRHKERLAPGEAHHAMVMSKSARAWSDAGSTQHSPQCRMAVHDMIVQWRPARSVVRRQHVTVGFDQIINQRPDLVKAEFGCGVGIEHGGVVDMLALARERRFHSQFLDIDVGAHQGR